MDVLSVSSDTFLGLKMKLVKFAFLIVTLLFMRTVLAAPLLPKTDAVPGGIVILPLIESPSASSTIQFQGRRVMMLHDGQRYYAVVGLPLTTKPGTYQINYIGQNGVPIKQPLVVHAKSYPAQYLTIKNKRKVNPNPTDLKRIAHEQITIDKIKDTWSATSQPSLSFNWPVKGPISSAFGLQRFYNGEPRTPHAGLDIAAPAGTPIKSPAVGRVIGTGNFFYSGNTVYVDHGQGLITMYGHMSAIKVKPGQVVKSGTLLGLVGQTGRATGPHLHWGVLLNKALVDPKLFIHH